MKRLLLLALSLALALTVTGCGGGGGADEGDAGGTAAGSASGPADALATPEDLAAALERDYGDTPWFAAIEDYTIETYLGAPVLVIHVPWSVTDTADTAQYDLRNQLMTAVQDYEITAAPNVAMLDGDLQITRLGSGGGGVPMSQAFSLPAQPKTAEELTAWLAAVYGPGGIVPLGPNEDWYGTITSITFGNPGWESEDMLVIETSAPTYYGDIRGPLILQAIYSSGSPLLQNYVLKTGDGGGPVGTAEDADGSEPGTNAFFYPAE